MIPSSRVAINAFSQYVRSIIMIIVALWVSRVILATLGVRDYGIYNLIGGVVAMLGFFRSNIASVTQRYLSYYQNENDKQILRLIFNNSIVVQIFISVGLCVLLLILTPLWFNLVLNIPQENVSSAKFVYFISIASLFFSMMSVPYAATLMARENIVFSSLVQIVESLLKIPIALGLTNIISFKLEWFAVFMFLLSVLNFLCFFVYCICHYEECSYFKLKAFDKGLFDKMLYFTGWEIYGTGCVIGRKQGIAILINNFYGVAINASYSIGYQVVAYIDTFSVSLLTAMRPQIIKSESSGNRIRAIRLAEMASKYSALLLSVITIPLLFCLNVFLGIWLVEIPDYTWCFCIGFIASLQINLLTYGHSIVAQAVGHVKKYNLLVSSIRLLTVPIAFIVLLRGGSPYYAMGAYAAIEVLFGGGRLLFLHSDIGYPLNIFLKNTLLPFVSVVFPNLIICYFVSTLATGLWGGTFIPCVVS
jgi:O-antigen/teichoic acid export membrane protein